MELAISLQSAANVATLIAPGYLALRLYAIVYSKRDKNFSQLLLESIVVSLPIVTVVSWLWQRTTATTVSSTNAWYVLTVLGVGALGGLLFAKLRVRRPLAGIAQGIGFSIPHEDFIRTQFDQLQAGQSVTVTLKNGEIVSGTPKAGSSYGKGIPREYYFKHVAWYNKDTSKWDNRPGGIILNLDEVTYIETPS